MSAVLLLFKQRPVATHKVKIKMHEQHFWDFLSVSLRECKVHVPAGSRPCVLTFLSPEKMTVRSYRSCLARDWREGSGKARVGLI